MFVIGFGKARISLLHVALQAFFGSEKSAQAVDVNGATLQYDSATILRRQKQLAAKRLIGARNNLRVLPVIWIFCPAVENEMIETYVAISIFHANRTGVAHPAAIRGDT